MMRRIDDGPMDICPEQYMRYMHHDVCTFVSQKNNCRLASQLSQGAAGASSGASVAGISSCTSAGLAVVAGTAGAGAGAGAAPIFMMQTTAKQVTCTVTMARRRYMMPTSVNRNVQEPWCGRRTALDAPGRSGREFAALPSRTTSPC